MSEEIDLAAAENLVNGAMGSLLATPARKILCTKRQLQDCLLRLAQEAYAMGFLAGQKEQFSWKISAGAAERPVWMDIPLEPENLARYGLRLRPVVVRSLIGAGYRQLGDLCWASEHELRKLSYVGRKTARQIRTAIRQLQTNPVETWTGSPAQCPDPFEPLRRGGSCTGPVSQRSVALNDSQRAPRGRLNHN